MRPVVALYDRLPIDYVELYRAIADVVLCTRYRPHTKVAPDAVAVLTTWTRPPTVTTCPVVLMSSGLEVVQHLGVSGVPVYRGPSWSSHAVAGWAISEMLRRADPALPIAVAGRGPIAVLIRRYLRRHWAAGLANTREAGGLILATPATEQPPIGWLEGRGQVVVSVTHRPWPWLAMRWALDTGRVAQAVVDVAPRDWKPDPRVALTGHSAWDGHRSAERRQRAVTDVLRMIAEDRLDTLPLIRTRTT